MRNNGFRANPSNTVNFKLTTKRIVIIVHDAQIFYFQEPAGEWRNISLSLLSLQSHNGDVGQVTYPCFCFQLEGLNKAEKLFQIDASVAIGVKLSEQIIQALNAIGPSKKHCRKEDNKIQRTVKRTRSVRWIPSSSSKSPMVSWSNFPSPFWSAWWNALIPISIIVLNKISY